MHHMSHVICHMSRVTYHMSSVSCRKKKKKFLTYLVEDLFSMGPTPPCFVDCSLSYLSQSYIKVKEPGAEELYVTSCEY